MKAGFYVLCRPARGWSAQVRALSELLEHQSRKVPTALSQSDDEDAPYFRNGARFREFP